MYSNEKSSAIKTAIETWFESTDLDEEENLKKLEDVVYCNDRSVVDMTTNGWSKDGDPFKTMEYSSTIRMTNRTPDLSCRGEVNNRDRFTYKDIVNGNGLLKWPVGLLSVDEILLAGGSNPGSNSDFYLYTGAAYWALSPNSFFIDGTDIIFIADSGGLGHNYGINKRGVRPVISLSSSVLPNLSGTGSETDPYVVN